MTAHYDIQHQKRFLMVNIRDADAIDRKSNLISHLLSECRKSRVKNILIDISGCDEVKSHSFRFEISKFLVLNHKNEYQLAVCCRDGSSRGVLSGLTANFNQHSRFHVSNDLDEAKSWLGVA